jgi:hypothetical protein
MTTDLRFNLPARIQRLTPTDELMQRALADVANDPSVFEENQPYFFAAPISNNLMDAYFTRMATSSLKNYEKDAKAGVSLQDSHASRRLGVGRSLSAKYSKDGDIEQVIADFYTVKGIEFNDATYKSTDDFIRAIRAGIAQDVSIGFYGGTWICSLCNVDMWDWDAGCRHWPGDEVQIKDPDSGKTIRTETIFAWVANAHLSEVSLVYDGATPGEMILKAERAMKEGTLTQESLRLLERRFHLQLPEARPVVAVGEHQFKENEKMTKETQERQTPPGSGDPTNTPSSEPDARDVVLADIRKALAGANFTGDNVLELVRSAVGEVNTLRTKVTELEKNSTTEPELRKLADEGRAYRNDLIEQAIEQGVRANGADFAQEQYKGILETSSLEVIKRMRDDWKTLADKTLQGGRKTVDGEENPTAPPATNHVPDAAFAV